MLAESLLEAVRLDELNHFKAFVVCDLFEKDGDLNFGSLVPCIREGIFELPFVLRFLDDRDFLLVQER